MIIKEYKNIPDFQVATSALIDTHHGAPEHENVMLLRILEGIKTNQYTDFRLWAIHDASTHAPLLAVVMTPPRNLTLSQGRVDAIPALRAYMLEQEIIFPGINGPSALTNAFACEWNQTSEQKLSPAKQLPLYLVDPVIPPRPALGRARTATLADLDLLVRWHVDFGVEAGMAPHECVPQPDRVQRKLERQGVLIWENPAGEPVSFAGHGQASPHGMTIGPVYTPPEHRGHGYASNLVVQLSESILNQGKWCGLFADAKNPISNKIYQQLGYRQVFEYQEYRFLKGHDDDQG